MLPPPIPLALAICEKIIIEEGTRNITLDSTFNKFRVHDFPSDPQRFHAYCLLTDGEGPATMELVVTRLETDQVIYSHELAASFPSRHAQVYAFFRVNDCVFPALGEYLITLLVDGDWVAHHRIVVMPVEIDS